MSVTVDLMDANATGAGPAKIRDYGDRALLLEFQGTDEVLAWSAQEVAAFVYKSAGTTALRAGTIQRLFRDMHAGTQHVTSAPPVFRALGRELSGLATGKKWLFLDLVDRG